MVKKKRTILTFIPTDKNLILLQNIGILNGLGRTTGKVNFNDWMNRTIYEKIGVNSPLQNGELQEKLILSEIQEIQRDQERRNKLTEERLRTLAIKLNEIRKPKNKYLNEFKLIEEVLV